MEKCICSVCGHEHDSDMKTPCPKCGSPRVILFSVAEDLGEVQFGSRWREVCFGKMEHQPQVLAPYEYHPHYVTQRARPVPCGGSARSCPLCSKEDKK